MEYFKKAKKIEIELNKLFMCYVSLFFIVYIILLYENPYIINTKEFVFYITTYSLQCFLWYFFYKNIRNFLKFSIYFYGYYFLFFFLCLFLLFFSISPEFSIINKIYVYIVGINKGFFVFLKKYVNILSLNIIFGVLFLFFLFFSLNKRKWRFFFYNCFFLFTFFFFIITSIFFIKKNDFIPKVNEGYLNDFFFTTLNENKGRNFYFFIIDDLIIKEIDNTEEELLEVTQDENHEYYTDIHEYLYNRNFFDLAIPSFFFDQKNNFLPILYGLELDDFKKVENHEINRYVNIQNPLLIKLKEKNYENIIINILSNKKKNLHSQFFSTSFDYKIHKEEIHINRGFERLMNLYTRKILNFKSHDFDMDVDQMNNMNVYQPIQEIEGKKAVFVYFDNNNKRAIVEDQIMRRETIKNQFKKLISSTYTRDSNAMVYVIIRYTVINENVHKENIFFMNNVLKDGLNSGE